MSIVIKPMIRALLDKLIAEKFRAFDGAQMLTLFWSRMNPILILTVTFLKTGILIL
jgi:hypothetical protein